MPVFFLVLAFFFIPTSGFAAAADEPAIVPDAATLRSVEAWNKKIARESKTGRGTRSVDRPFLEHEKAGYVLFDDSFSYNTDTIKTTIAKNLPDGVSLAVVARSTSEAEVRQTFGRFLPAKRLLVIPVKSTATSFWARDGLPIPVFTEDDKPALVDAKYYHRFEPDREIAKFFKEQLFSHEYYFEGGNFAPDHEKRCLIVNNERVKEMPNDTFEEMYGCSEVIRLPFRAGIGHIDERLKILSDDVAVTDEDTYVKPLKDLGYEVHKLPRNTDGYHTYANSLLVNGTIFLPVYGKANDAKAAQIYKDLGFKVVTLQAAALSQGKGSVHCITMTYPPMAKREFENQMRSALE